jgi:hypothetical protein
MSVCTVVLTTFEADAQFELNIENIKKKWLSQNDENNIWGGPIYVGR